MNPQAEALNKLIQEKNPAIFELLSEKGKNIFFPKKGILGQTAEAKGKKYNATIGAAVEDDGSPMRFKCLEELINLEPSMTFPYAPSFGRPDIRNKWKELLYKKNEISASKELSLPVVSNALTHGLSMAAYMFLNAGENIIIPDLFWGNYNLIFSQAYGTSYTTYPLYKDGGFDVESFDKTLVDNPGKQVLLLNFPNNPTGYTPTFEESDAIVDCIKKSADRGNNVVVFCDDAYFGLVFEEGIEQHSIFKKLCDLHENVLAVKLDGPTKEDYVWGFRVGFMTYGVKGGDAELYEALASKTAGAIRGNISNATNPGQSMLLKAYESPNYWTEKEEKYVLLKDRYNAVKTALANNDYTDMFTALPYNSGYFMCIDLTDGIDGEELRQLLIAKYDTGVIFASGVIRIAFAAVAASDIDAIFANIYNACKELAGK